jgi:hypothetical protein
MQPLLAIVWLTWKAAVRFRLFWVLAVLLAGSVVLLPLLLQDDGTAQGFTQILLTYSLSVITALLGLATLWLSCGTLARDIEDCQIQMVVVKPIARWQVWLGKWLGIVSLDALMLLLSGACVAGLLQWRARRLPEDQQKVLRREILVSRAALKEAPTDVEGTVEEELKKRLQGTEGPINVETVRKQVRGQVLAGLQVVRPNWRRRWTIELGLNRLTLKDEPLVLRIKFQPAQTNAANSYVGYWEIGPPDSAKRVPILQPSLSAATYHEFPIPPNLFDDNGRLTIDFANRNPTALFFPLDDGLEVLYRQGGFTMNFLRGLGVILCWLALLASLGLAGSSFLSFPVAAFVCASLLLVGLSSGTLASAVEAGTVGSINEETGASTSSPLDMVLIPLFKVLLKVLNVVQGYSPIDALSTGRSIPWLQLAAAAAQIVLFLGGILALFGIIAFSRRELATAQGNS